MADTLLARLRKLQGATDEEIASEQRAIQRHIDARDRARMAALALGEPAHTPVIPDGYVLVSSRYLTALEAIAEREQLLASAANQRPPIQPGKPADAAAAARPPSPPALDRRVVEI